MTAATHRLGGLASGMILVASVQTNNEWLIVLGAVLGSLIPDIDNKNSAISRRWRVTSFLVFVGQGIIRLLSNLFPRKQKSYIRSMIGHRGITHSLIPVILIPLLAVGIKEVSGSTYIDIYPALALSVGIISHILFDMLSGGVPLLIPFSTKRICLARIKTGGVAEWLFRVALVGVFVSFGYKFLMKVEGFSEWQRLLHL